MGSIESLNDGQRAVLQLLLRQGKSYDDIAALLRSDPGSIRRRAQGAVEALGPENAGVSADRRREIADYLLGQQSISGRAATREYLEASADGRGWARSTAAALAPLAAEDALPDIPAEREEVAEAFDALEARTARQEEVERNAKRGGWLISAGLGLVLALIIIGVVALVSSGGGDSPKKTAASTTPAATTPAATTPAGGTATTGGTTTVPGNPVILVQGVLRPPAGSGSTASGQVAIVRFDQGPRFRLALTAKNIPPSSTSGSAYGVWFYTSKKAALFLGFPDKVVGANGKLDTVADLNPNTPNFKEVLLTSERSNAPKTPGAVVLRAKLVIATPAQAQAQAQGGAQSTTPAPATTVPGG
jgi:hypothetical protein